MQSQLVDASLSVFYATSRITGNNPLLLNNRLKCVTSTFCMEYVLASPVILLGVSQFFYSPSSLQSSVLLEVILLCLELPVVIPFFFYAGSFPPYQSYLIGSIYFLRSKVKPVKFVQHSFQQDCCKEDVCKTFSAFHLSFFCVRGWSIVKSSSS